MKRDLSILTVLSALTGLTSSVGRKALTDSSSSRFPREMQEKEGPTAGGDVNSLFKSLLALRPPPRRNLPPPEPLLLHCSGSAQHLRSQSALSQDVHPCSLLSAKRCNSRKHAQSAVVQHSFSFSLIPLFNEARDTDRDDGGGGNSRGQGSEVCTALIGACEVVNVNKKILFVK